MTCDEITVLMRALAAGRLLRFAEAATALNAGAVHTFYVIETLTAAGALQHTPTIAGYGQYQITEKGRIACALIQVKSQRQQGDAR